MKGDSPPPNNEAWVHADTLFVESSTKKSDACTLSSDLLCLEICTCTVTQCHDKRSNTATTTTTTTTTTTMEILAAGGVDGRIHFFEIPKERTEPIQRIYSIAAHDGRVNSLCWDPIDSFLYSIGHDGCVCCWSIDKHHDQSEDNLYQQQIRVRVVTKFSIANERITAIAIGNSICNSTTNNHLAVGTHNGSIYFLSLQHIDNNWELGCIRKHAIECYEGCPIITSLCMLHVPGRPNDDVSSICVLVVGHSLGMGYITV
jgi:WD40 repeat protein